MKQFQSTEQHFGNTQLENKFSRSLVLLVGSRAMGACTLFGLGPAVYFEMKENGGKFKALDITVFFSRLFT